jgi:amino-acid N-acetyltransferase
VTIKQGTDSWRIRTATPRDREVALTLLREAKLTIEGVEDNFPAGYIVAETGEQVIAVAGMEKYGSFGLLRSLAVSPDWRRMGIGKALTERLLALAWTMSLEAVYLLTTTAPTYFAGKGFRRVDREDVPAEILASAEFARACPASALCMVKKIY